MSKDGRYSVRLGDLEAHLKRLAAKDRRSLGSFLYYELEKIVRRRVPDYRPNPAPAAEVAEPAAALATN